MRHNNNNSNNNNNNRHRMKNRNSSGGSNYSSGSSNNSNNNGPRRSSSTPSRTQIFDSNGPDVRIRGTAWQVHEKYQALAKDAAAIGDVVVAENYSQHAEHYQRIINSFGEQVSNWSPPVADNDMANTVQDDAATVLVQPEIAQHRSPHANPPRADRRDDAGSGAEQDLGLPSTLFKPTSINTTLETA